MFSFHAVVITALSRGYEQYHIFLQVVVQQFNFIESFQPVRLYSESSQDGMDLTRAGLLISSFRIVKLLLLFSLVYTSVLWLFICLFAIFTFSRQQYCNCLHFVLLTFPSNWLCSMSNHSGAWILFCSLQSHV